MRPVRVGLALGGVAALGLGLLAVSDADFRKLEFSRLPTRAAWQLPERVIDALGVAAGDWVADLGAGDGYFLGYLAAAVGASGRVYAVDVDAGAVAALRRKVEDGGLANVEVVEGSTTDARLPGGEIDLVFLCNVYHHIDAHVAYFARLRADLSPAGRVAVVEARPDGWGMWVSPAGHATPRDALIAQMREAGYRLDERHDFLPIQHLLIFRPDPGV